MQIFIVFITSLCCTIVTLHARSHEALRHELYEALKDPEAYLNKSNSLLIMGNAPLDKARFLFLPEIHDDASSLKTQFLLLAREHNRNRPFVVFDESLTAFQRSIWDIFSQKTIEIATARDQRHQAKEYEPRSFESAMHKVANDLRVSTNGLIYLDSELWSLPENQHRATPFFGWDVGSKASLTERNVKMVDTLKKASDKNERMVVMLGARHVPELEFWSSKKLLCNKDSYKTANDFFTTVHKKYGDKPELLQGVGATLPIHKFLEKQSYAVVFDKAIFKELDDVVNQFKKRLGPNGCIKL